VVAVPRAVMLTHEPPFPPVSGGRIRSYNMLRQLHARGWSLGIFALTVSAAEAAEAEPGLRELCDDVVLATLPGGRARHRRLARALVRREAFQAHYFHDAPAAATLRSSGLLDGADVVIPSPLYMLPYVPPELAGRTALDTQNSEVRRLGSMMRSAPLSARGLVARIQLPAVRRYEAEAVRGLWRTLAVSAEEQAEFDAIAPGRAALVPNGADLDGLAPRGALPAAPEALFVGTMSYGANEDGARWLLEEVLPLTARSDLRVNVVGAGPPPSLVRLAQRASRTVEVTGFVPDTAPWFARSRALVVPLRIGGGTRLKILEALARGVPVLSTTLGAEGLDLEPGRDLLVADEPQAFAAALDRLMEDDELCAALARRGRAAAEAYDWNRVGDRLAAALEPDGYAPAASASTSARRPS
jgi:glycosyltransferase involved in cell wall biosynthesis